MSLGFVVSCLLAATFLALATRATTREDASLGVAFGVLAIASLAPFPFSIAIGALAGAAFHLHRREVARVQADRDMALAHMRNAPGAVGARIDDLRDPIAVAAVTRFRESKKVIAESQPPPPERDERRAEDRVSKARSRFMAAMGHELRSPLNSIIGFAQVLEDGADGPLTPAQRENVTLVRVAAEELLLLLTDILDSSRLEAGRVKLDRKWTASVEILTLTTQRARPMLDAAERDVDVEMQPGLPALLVDRARVAQSLQNLLRQALKTHGGGKGHLRIRARTTVVSGKPMVRFDVIDPSRDLSDADVQNAFDPDPDLPRSAARSLALGLALGLARDLTRLHGGEAGCENLGGACWFLLLPVEQGPRGDAPLRARHESKDAPARGRHDNKAR